jgi:hypothetical protein
MQDRLFTVPTCYKSYSTNQPYFFQPIDRMFQSGASRPSRVLKSFEGRPFEAMHLPMALVASGGAVFLWFHIFFGGYMQLLFVRPALILGFWCFAAPFLGAELRGAT